MEVTKRATVPTTARRIHLSLFSLVIVHQFHTIFAFPLNSVPTRYKIPKTLNRHKEHSNQLGRKLRDVSRILSTANNEEELSVVNNRRHFLSKASTTLLSNSAAWMLTTSLPMAANAAGELPDRFNVDDYLKTGMVMNPMGVSGQSGKSKPVTGM